MDIECDCPRARHEHGTREMYNRHRCRCGPCKKEKTDRQREDRHRATRNGWTLGRPTLLRDATGIRRRVQALQAIGYSLDAIAAEMGVTQAAVFLLCRYRQVSDETADRVIRTYDQLWDKPRPGRGGNITRRIARSKGYPPPLAWDEDTIDDPTAAPWTDDGHADGGLDEIAVERLVAGDLEIPLGTRTPPELVEAVRLLAARGWTDVQIGHRIRRRNDAVLKIRERHGIPAGVARTGSFDPRSRKDDAA